MAAPGSVIIFGASGNVGEFVIPALLHAGAKVTVVTRAESKITFQFSSGVDTVTADYESLDSLIDVIKGHEAVISLVGKPGLQHQIRVIDAAVAAGAKYFIPTEFGHDTQDGRVSGLLPLFKVKNASTEYLRARETDGLAWTGVITGLFFDWGLPFGMFDVNLKEGKAKIWDRGNTKFLATNTADIAAAVTRLILDPAVREKAKNKFVYLASVETTQNEIVAVAEEVMGKKFEVEHIVGEDVLKESLNKVAKGDGSALLAIIKGVALSSRGLCQYKEKVDMTAEFLLPGPRETVKDVVRRVIEGSSYAGKLVQ